MLMFGYLGQPLRGRPNGLAYHHSLIDSSETVFARFDTMIRAGVIMAYFRLGNESKVSIANPASEVSTNDVIVAVYFF